jgi:transposase-like protein
LSRAGGPNLAELEVVKRNQDRQKEAAMTDQGPELAGVAVEETLTYYAFPEEHWQRIRTNNPLERVLPDELRLAI